ncbi:MULTISPECIES: peroxiredoxin [unclassified Nitratiruptor]|uniref:peroxiredoxin n=1 Tax=unclassified Nitratiruptor TaxID=2624044 RepID=UPI00191697E7|nr:MULTISPECIES: peroxiredoxin [unclassified Nitratiruptor]BCD59284.1 peroxiredoxin [Nitratiruptor sp. YY08-10]BCD63208.1 peroxiredoxin [Nitratiruptor sp. YY08-14]
MGFNEKLQEILDSQVDVVKKVMNLVSESIDELKEKAKAEKRSLDEVIDEILQKVNINKKEGSMGMPLLGDKFPSINVQTTHGPMSLPDDLKGKWTVLFSHPADFTPVCTTEFVSFQKHKKDFDAIGAQLIGLSIDQVFSHIKWVEWIKERLDVEIEFPIIAATDTLAAKIGMIHPNKGTNTVRAVFIIDPEGIVRTILYYPQEIGRNIPEIVRAVKALQKSDAEGVATPANWPENELIGDKVIIPPATDCETAKKRTEEYSCYDWWFCYKESK